MRGPGTLRLGSRSASYYWSLLMPLSSRWQDRADGGHPDEREQVVMDPKTLQVLRREPFAAMSRGQRWRSWVRFTHTGEAGGWWGETLALVRHAGRHPLDYLDCLVNRSPTPLAAQRRVEGTADGAYARLGVRMHRALYLDRVGQGAYTLIRLQPVRMFVGVRHHD
jgi:hypothetical protein